jgi:hypothetical protein
VDRSPHCSRLSQADRSCTRYLRRCGKISAIWPTLRLLQKSPTKRGFPASQAERSGSEAVSSAYEQNRPDALAAGVFGSPVYVLDGEVFWRQDRIEVLADALKSGRVAYSSQV